MHIGFFEFVLGMMVLGTISTVITGGMKMEKHRIRMRVGEGENEVRDLKALVNDMHQEITTLKDRVRVLERLATDGDRNLASEIERLRRSETRSGV